MSKILQQLAGIRAKLDAIEKAILSGVVSPDLTKPLSDPVLSLNWSVRARSVIENEGITTVGQVSRMLASELLRCRNCGMVTLASIRSTLAEVGLSLLGEPSPARQTRPEPSR